MNSLSEKLYNKVARRLANLRVGDFGDVKSLKGSKGIYEMRIHDGPGYRVYYGRKDSVLIVLLSAGKKGT